MENKHPLAIIKDIMLEKAIDKYGENVNVKVMNISFKESNNTFVEMAIFINTTIIRVVLARHVLNISCPKLKYDNLIKDVTIRLSIEAIDELVENLRRSYYLS